MKEDDSSSSCSLFNYVGVNDLSINDIVVKSATGDTVCIKARFSLAIKVEALIGNFLNNNSVEDRSNKSDNNSNNNTETSTENNSNNNIANSDKESSETGATEERPIVNRKIVLGYIPLDVIVNVEDNCPDEIELEETEANHSNQTNGDQQNESKQNENQTKELEMNVKFDCGSLKFNFKKEEIYYLSAIKGVVNIGSSTTREFISEQPMFLTSDLTHHFRFNDLIEVNSTTKVQGFILTANFYNSEFETFRNTTSRGFIRPPDENSKPFIEPPE